MASRSEMSSPSLKWAHNFFASPRSKTKGSKTIMTDANEKEVKDIERVEVEPTEDDETVEPKESSTEEKEEESTEESETEEAPEKKENEETEEAEEESDEESKDGKDKEENAGIDDHGNPKRLPDETIREFALRLQVTKLRGQLKGERKSELFDVKQVQSKTDAKEDEVLKKYKPEDVEGFKTLAKSLGFVQKNEIEQSSYQEKSSSELDKFLEKHTEYLPENDKDNTLWERLKEEFSMYAQPKNPKDYSKILERAHQAVFNIQPISKLKNNIAAKEKIKVASHSGAPRQTNGQSMVTKHATSGIRTDMLKGFSDEEKSEIEGGE